MTSTRPDCQALEGALARAADGAAIDPVERASLDAHLARCPACREALQDQRLVRQALADAGWTNAPSSVHARVMDALARETPWISRWNWQRWTWRLAPLAAAAVVLLVVVLSRSVTATGAVARTDAALSASPTSTSASTDWWSASVSDTSVLESLLNRPSTAAHDGSGKDR